MLAKVTQSNSKHRQRNKPKQEHSLRTGSNIKHSLSLIKEEMEYCLKQSQVPCYTDSKTDVYRHRIKQLESEYKAILWEVRKRVSVTEGGPSSSQAYKQKELRCVPTHLCKIDTPILDKPENKTVAEQPTRTQCAGEFMDRPLEFQIPKGQKIHGTTQLKKGIHPLGIDYSSSDEEM